ncbi:hypothetical protein TRAPUB_7045 [Trametes pubescens]|uniref:GATA-type domain-containing protein n=1 Tax=Trametes pubescens TaxID=154538 RepID=A0A1M2V4G1_TRAPU|nr:hypothetical protein TRAPUB_7045 [Trametes pubescens]
MSSSHPPQYASYSLPPVQDSVRLPSIKDLNFPPPGQDGNPTNGNVRPEHPRQRHDTPSWSRSNASAGPPQSQHPQHSQHSSNMPPPHDPPPKSHPHPSQRHDASYGPPGSGPSPQQPPAGMPTHNGMNAGPTRSENGTDPSSKRSRPQAAVSASPGRSPHTAYPSYPAQAPPPGYHQGPPPQAPPPHEQPQHPSQFSHGPPPGYSGYPPPPLPQRHYPMPPPPPPPHHQAQPPPSPYPPAGPPPEHWQQHPPSQPPPHAPQQFNGFTRTTPLVPAPVEARTSAPSPADAERAAARQQVITEILKHCGVLYGFANHYSQASTTHPHVQPAPPEIEEMNSRASTVVRLLDDLRRLDAGEDINRKESVNGAATPAEDHPRPPKRPWEDMARDGEPPSSASYSDAPGHLSHPDEQAQSTAEQDMQIIRNKRQSSAGGAQPGQQKNKYRKRSRATPPGKCHSCNIRETPEWRRGPDGARTLCNACGLHYAKLMRKRDKALDANGKAPPIDLQTLRASTASARGSGSTGSGDHSGESAHPQQHQGPPPPSPYEQPKQAPQMHPPPPHPHQGPYQLMPVGAPGPSGQPHQMMPPPPHGSSAPHSANGAPVPPPPWLASPVQERGGYSAEPQSYMRASHPPSHARASPQ